MSISAALRIPAGFAIASRAAIPAARSDLVIIDDLVDSAKETPEQREIIRKFAESHSEGVKVTPVVPKTEAANIAIPETKRSKFSPSEERILKLLTDGHSQELVASTLGLTPSAISQCISRDDFRAELAARKSVALQRYKTLDDTYDRIEEKLATKLEASVFMMSRPGEIVAALTKVNAMKRRVGVTDNGSSNPTSPIVNITVPVQIVHKFTTTQEGHIVGIDGKSLITIPSGALAKLTQTIPKLEHK